ncbi:hypothetical protein FOYG_16475 [Fusarium oxysporum NRRL 32931]|uniref:Uncharacterized protein n=1 Tax=Fusarium oxysporum NRRL 32931 TaxID=660029 RepID=W9HHP8_FUSOX|nr:hypothetical protein FOYG_16475 [Fusarium oxysporum NRRL 32931]
MSLNKRFKKKKKEKKRKKRLPIDLAPVGLRLRETCLWGDRVTRLCPDCVWSLMLFTARSAGEVSSACESWNLDMMIIIESGLCYDGAHVFCLHPEHYAAAITGCS